MDFAYSDDQQALRDLAGRIFADHVDPERLRMVEAGPERFDRNLWQLLARAGLLGVSLPEDVGGSGRGVLELCVVLEQQGRSVAPVPLWETLALGALPIARFGTPDQCRGHLPEVVEGRAVLTAALPEPGRHASVRAAARAGPAPAWTLSGSVPNVPALHLAARVLVPAVDDDGRGLVFVVDPDADGLEMVRADTTSDGVWFRLELDGVVVGEPELLRGDDEAPDVLTWMRDLATLGLCALAVGVTSEALGMTAEYTRTREQFGRPISSFQAVGQRLADAYVDVEAIRLTALQAAWRWSEGLDAGEAVAVAKFWAADGGHRVVQAAQHLHGGIGVDVEYPLHRYFRRAKELELLLGGATHQLLRIGAALAAGEEETT